MEKEQIAEQADFRKGNLEKVGGPISLENVRLWTENYRRTNDKDVTTSHFFGRNVIENILCQKGCVGIRMHYALDNRGHKQLILSGVDKFGKDQLPNHTHTVQANIGHAAPIAEHTTAEMEGEFRFYDQSWPCPETKGC